MINFKTAGLLFGTWSSTLEDSVTRRRRGDDARRVGRIMPALIQSEQIEQFTDDGVQNDGRVLFEALDVEDANIYWSYDGSAFDFD